MDDYNSFRESHQLRVVVADTDDDCRRSLVEALKKDNWYVVECLDGPSVIAALKEKHASYLLYLCIDMPEAGSATCLDNLSRLDVDLHLRFITNGPCADSIAARMMAEAREIDVRRTIYKPIVPAEFCATVAKDAQEYVEGAVTIKE
ncbi:hypothetical protein [Thioclava kandeliae]|uniref:Response regulatory domain-containing protein n=1 Tax=Thioclava kandeliae TaxID=3070818 RepID=A0ABV1SN56_9RHOB